MGRDFSTLSLIYFVAGLALTVFVTRVLRWLCLRAGIFIRDNFQGFRVPAIGGVALVAAGGLLLLIEPLTDATFRLSPATDSALLSFGALGLVDDIWGNRSSKGFRGHIRALIHNRRLTTGAIKAIGGAGLAVWIAWSLHSSVRSAGPFGMLSEVILPALLIALCANTFNLLDLRPGRSTLIAMIVVAVAYGWCAFRIAALGDMGVFSRFDLGELIGTLLGCSLGAYLLDRNAMTMLGDTGSNALGAALGVMSAGILPMWGVAAAVVALAAFQLWCESHSLSAFIESKPLLRALDRKIGVR